jgi:hypothetical protein
MAGLAKLTIPTSVAVIDYDYTFGNFVSTNAFTTTNIFTTNVFVIGNLIDTANTTPGYTTLSITGNAVVSNALTVPSLYANTLSLSNVGSTITLTGNVNVPSNAFMTANVFASGNMVVTGTTNPGVTRVALADNLLVGNAIATTNVFTGNLVAIGNWTVGGLPGITSLNVIGNTAVSNAVTTTNVFTGNVLATGNMTIGGLPRLTTLNVTGNAYVSNAVTSSNVFATGRMIIAGGPTGDSTLLYGSANLFVSNAVSTTNVWTTNVTATGNMTISGLPALTSATITGNVLVGNTVTTTNVWTNNVTATGQMSLAGLPGLTTVSILGNALVSNTLTTTNVWTNNVISTGQMTVTGRPGETTARITGNAVVANALTTNNVFAGNVFASGSFVVNGESPALVGIPSDFVAIAFDDGVTAVSSTGTGTSWTQGTIPIAFWNSITVNPKTGMYVAVAAGGTTAAYSIDKINWTPSVLPVSAGWRSVTVNPLTGVFVAVASGSSIAASSIDGFNWIERTLPASANWISVTVNPTTGVFAAVSESSSSIAASSIDGFNWIERTLPTSANWISVTVNSRTGVFAAVAYNSTNAASSVDGFNWIGRTLPVIAFWNSVTVNPVTGVFAAVADSTIAASSVDGFNWIERALPTSGLWRSVTVSSATGVFVAVAQGSSGAASSVDGFNWLPTTLPTNDDWITVTSSSFIDIAEANINGNVFVSNAFETTNVFAATISSNLVYLTGNVFVSNAIQTQNIWATNVYASNVYIKNTGLYADLVTKSIGAAVWTSTQAATLTRAAHVPLYVESAGVAPSAGTVWTGDMYFDNSSFYKYINGASPTWSPIAPITLAVPSLNAIGTQSITTTGTTAIQVTQAVDATSVGPVYWSLSGQPPDVFLSNTSSKGATIIVPAFMRGSSTSTVTVSATNSRGTPSQQVFSLGITMPPILIGTSRDYPVSNASVLRQFTSTDGNYWYQPLNTGTQPVQLYTNFTNATAGKGLVLIARGRESTDWWNSGGQNYSSTSATLTSAALNINTPIAVLSDRFVNSLIGNWRNMRMLVNRINGGDSWFYTGTSDGPFSWNYFRHVNGDNLQNNWSPSLRTRAAGQRWLGTFRTGAISGTTPDTAGWTDMGQYTGNDCSRIFTGWWSGHGSWQGWSGGASCTPAGSFQNTTEGHALQLVNCYMEC